MTLADLLGSVLRALRHADPASSRVPSCRGCVPEPEPEPFAIAAGGQPDEALVPRDTGLLGGLELGGPAMEVMLSQTTGIPALLMHQEAESYGIRQLPRAATCGPDPSCWSKTEHTGGAEARAADHLTPSSFAAR